MRWIHGWYTPPPSPLSYLFVFIYSFIYGYLSYLPLLLSTALRSLQKKRKERKTRKKESKQVCMMANPLLNRRRLL